jgi:hypothetical protein
MYVFVEEHPGDCIAHHAMIDAAHDHGVAADRETAMTPLMTLAEARSELAGPRKRGAEGFVRNAAAAAVVYMHDAIRRGTMTNDAVRIGPMFDRPGRTHDQPLYQPFEKSREWLSESARGVRLDESWANIQGPNTPNPGEEVGADLVQTLPGDVSSYYIAADERGRACVYRYRLPQIDPGRVGNSRGTMTRTMDRGPDYYRSLARKGQTARELAAAPLRAINEANAKYWSKQKAGRDG